VNETPGERIRVGIVRKPFGIRGGCHIALFGATLTHEASPFPVYLGKNGETARSLTVTSLLPVSRGYTCFFREIATRDQAEEIRGHYLFVDGSRLPELDGDSFYHFELEGMRVVGSASGNELGQVETVFDFPTTDALEIRLDDARTIIVPFTRECVPGVDTRGRTVTVDESLIDELM